jgi:hypothetical protein
MGFGIGKTSIIRDINIADQETWHGKIFLSFDIDWAHDEVFRDTLDIVENYSVKATWFVTHETPLLKTLKTNSLFELGIHPNFNFLLNGDCNIKENADDIIEKLMTIVPEAKSVRSHSLVQGTRLLDSFIRFGITHESNHFIPHSLGFTLKPWLLHNGLCRVPFFWADDYHVSSGSEGSVNLVNLTLGGGMKVFDFHPIHVFLNSESLDRYERTRDLHRNPKELIKHRYDGYGTRNRLIELLELAKSV